MEFNVADLFESVVDAVPDRVAVVSGHHRLTYRQLEERANRLAHHLGSVGVEPEEHVGLYLCNDTAYLEGLLAAYKLRAVPINVNYRYVEEELAYLFDDADLVAVVHHRRFAPQLEAIRRRVPRLRHLLVVDDESGVDANAADSVDYDDALAAAPPAREFGPRSGDDRYVLYTGGTTGMPKGVVWRQEDLYLGVLAAAAGGDPERPEQVAAHAEAGGAGIIVLPACPLMHGAGQWAALGALLGGGRLVLSQAYGLDPDDVWKLVGREAVVALTVVGDAIARPLVECLAGAPERYDASSLAFVSSGGAILSAGVRAALQDLVPGVVVMDGFGGSETGRQAATFEAREGPGLRFRPTSTTSVLDADLRPVVPGSGAVGRLASTGRIPLGYYKDTAKTKATFVDVEGARWVLPGDMATVEADGSITVFGRGSLVVNTGGEKVYPEEVEAALVSHPDVVDALIVGAPDDRWGERVVAVVQPAPGRRPTLDELSRHCSNRIAAYKVPREVHLVDAVQRSPSGKGDYRWARDLAEQGSVDR